MAGLENSNKKGSSLKQKDLAIIKIAVAALIAVICYLFGTSLEGKTASLKQENSKLAERVAKLEDAQKNEDELNKNLQKITSDTKYILKKFPSNYTFEKAMKKVCELWDERYAFGMTSMSYADNGVFYTFMDKTGKEDESLGKISSVTVTIEYSTDLDTLKTMIDLINQKFDTKVTIETIDINPSEDIKSVEGSVVFTLYYGATERPYEEPKFDVDIGKKNMFE